jgi:hypothetical protein
MNIYSSHLFGCSINIYNIYIYIGMRLNDKASYNLIIVIFVSP